MRISLPFKTAIIFFLITFAGVVLIAILGYQASSRLLQNDALVNLSSGIERESSILEAAIKTIKEDVRFLSQIPPVAGIIRASQREGFDERENTMEDVWKRRMAEIFKTVIRQRPAYTQIRFIGIAANGREIVRVNKKDNKAFIVKESELQTKGKRVYFKEISAKEENKIYISDIRFNREHGQISIPYQPVLRVGMPVYKSNVDIFGVIVINIDLHKLADSLYLPQDNQFFFLTNEQGEYLIHPNKEKRFAFELNRSSKVQDEYGLSKELLPGLSIGEFATLSLPEKDAGIAFHKIHYDDTDKNRFLLIGSVASFTQINEKSVALGKKLTYLTLILFFILGIVTAFAIRWLTRPILKLKTASDRIASGEQGVEIEITSKDEIGDLARSMSAMVAGQVKSREELRSLADSLERKVKERTIELESLNKEMEDFVNTVSHDLKSPIVSIRGLIDLICQELGDTPPGDIKTYIGHMKNSVEMMGQLTEDLIELSRVGCMDYKQEHVEMNDVVSQVITELSGTVEERNINMRVQPNLPPVMANKKRVYQVFSNIVGNAVKFMPKTTQMPLIEITGLHNKNGFIEFSVMDNGDGLDPKHHDKIFKMFQRVHGREIPGTGMGLTFVKKVVENFGGSISVESSVGNGVVFRFTIPAVKNL